MHVKKANIRVQNPVEKPHGCWDIWVKPDPDFGTWILVSTTCIYRPFSRHKEPTPVSTSCGEAQRHEASSLGGLVVNR